MESENPQSKAEDKRAEYTALRTEIVQADNACLLMTGYILIAVGALYQANLEWLASFLSLIGLFYYTEKRFSIRHIANFILEKISTKGSGFEWEKHVAKLRKDKELRPWMFLRPYNAEVILCCLVALSPILDYIPKVSSISQIFPYISFTSQQSEWPTFSFWVIFTIVTWILGIKNAIHYRNLGAKPKVDGSGPSEGATKNENKPAA